MNKIKLTLSGIGIILSVFAMGQDFQFSQFYNSPLNLNPALTGSINGKERVIVNYRNLRSQVLGEDSYKTYALSFDHRMNLKSGNYIGLGIAGISDRVGELDYGLTQGNLSFSFAKIISRADSASTSHKLIGGIQIGLARRSIDLTNARWPSQFESFDFAPPPDLDGFMPDFLHPDLNFGLTWVSKFSTRKSLHLGLTAFHINEPNISFFKNESEVPLSLRIAIHAGGELPIANRLSIMPSFIFLDQGVHSQFNLGAKLNVAFKPNSFLSFVQGGLFYSAGNQTGGGIHSNAIIMMLSLQFKDIQIGFSFDQTISNLRAGNNRTDAFEVSLGYLIGRSNDEITSFNIPQI